MRIAMVSDHAGPVAARGALDRGGQNVHVDGLSRSLVARGHEVVVFTRRDAPHLPARLTTTDGVTVVYLDAGPPQTIDEDDLFPYMDEMGLRLLRAMASMSIDVLHSHFWMAAYSSQLAVQQLDLPWVHTSHALASVRIRHQRDDRRTAVRLAIECDTVRRADAVVATCADEVRELRDMGAGGRRVEVIPCGFDAGRFRPVHDRGNCARPLACTVSRLVPRKGVADVIRAMARVPAMDLAVAGGSVAGSGLTDHERDLRQLVHDLDLDDRVRFLRAVDSAEVAALHRSSDFFVAAPWYEPFGIAPVEAMGSGLPVVGTAVGGMLDTVVDGVTGLLVPPHDVDALADAMALVVASHEVRAQLGRRAARRAHLLYPWELVAERFETVYGAVVCANRAPVLAEVSA